MDRPHLTVEEAAAWLGVSEGLVRKWINAHLLPAAPLPATERGLYIYRPHLDDFLSEWAEQSARDAEAERLKDRRERVRLAR